MSPLEQLKFRDEKCKFLETMIRETLLDDNFIDVLAEAVAKKLKKIEEAKAEGDVEEEPEEPKYVNLVQRARKMKAGFVTDGEEWRGTYL